MHLVWGILLTISSFLAWIVQLISTINPNLAEQWGLVEAQSDVEQTFHTDALGEAYWDALILWILPLAGILLILDNPVWVYFGLVGSGMYLYFAGRGIVVRRKMQQDNIRIGSQESKKGAYLFLVIWGLTAIITILYGIFTLRSSIG